MSAGRGFAAGALALSACLSAASALGAPCGRPDVDYAYPYNGATGVPSNATFSAHYAAPADFTGVDDVPLTDSMMGVVAINPPKADPADNTLSITPLAPLAPGTYTIAWPALKAVNGGTGQGATVSFSVKAEEDTQAPRFAGLSGIDWDLAREHDPCLSGLEDRFAFELAFGSVSDDSDISLLRVTVFETMDSGTRLASAVPIASVPWPASGELEVKRNTDSSGTTCFSARVFDLVGLDSGGGEPEVCKKTREPPFFEGCALSRQRAAPTAWAVFASALMLFSWLRRGVRAGDRRRD